MLLGIDLGFSQIKAVWDGGKTIFPSVIGQPIGEELRDPGIQRVALNDDLWVKLDGDIYYVGNKAIRDTNNHRITFKADKTNDLSDKIKYLTVLGIAVGPVIADRVDVITGLPVDEFNDLKDVIKQNMSGTFRFVFRDKPFEVRIGKVVVIPQSAGAFYNQILDEDGSINTANPLATGKVAVIDAGSRTTNVIVMERGRYVGKESFTIFTGVTQIHNGVRKLIHQKWGLVLKPAEMDQVVRSGEVMINGQSQTVLDLIDIATAPVAEEIISEIRLHIPDQRRIDHFLITGGGSLLMEEQFMAEYHGHCIAGINPEFGNARGYYKYGKFLARAGK